jgi:hypothetical protein
MVQDVDDKFFERADVSTSRGGCLSSMAMFPPWNMTSFGSLGVIQNKGLRDSVRIIRRI